MDKKPDATEHVVQGNRLVCPICQHSEFWTRTSMMNTKGLTFLDLDWANKTATNYVCDHCGYVMWFLEKKG